MRAHRRTMENTHMSLRSPKAQGQVTRAILRGNLREKGRTQAHKSHFVWTCTRKVPDPDPGTHGLCAPAQSKRTWAFHKSHFFVEVYKKSAGPRSRGARFLRACAVEAHMDISQEPFCVEIYRKNAAPASAHLD